MNDDCLWDVMLRILDANNISTDMTSITDFTIARRGANTVWCWCVNLFVGVVVSANNSRMGYEEHIPGQTRDWNEELQTTRELPRKTLPQRLVRERAIFKVNA